MLKFYRDPLPNRFFSISIAILASSIYRLPHSLLLCSLNLS